MLTQVQLERATKQFQQHLKANLGDRRVIATLAELISDKSV